MKNGSKVSFVECVLVSSARILRTLTHLHISTWGTGSGKFNWRMLRETFHHLLQLVHTYESFSDVGEIRVYFASKILTPCRMH